MTEKKREKRGLGRGLSALMADVAISEETPQDTAVGTVKRADMLIPIEKISPNPDQPRRQFVQEDLQDLSNSIREKGIIQPLILRESPTSPGNYEIVAGERRWRAAQLAQLHEVPALVRELTDTEVLELAIIENIQRADLNPVEEAAGYRQLMDKFGHTQEQMSDALGKSRSHIANLLRLLNLPEEVLGYLRVGKLSAGHARALVTSENAAELAREVIRKGLSVRDTERLVKKPKAAAPKPAASREKDADTRALESDLTANLGMKVVMDHKPGQEAGKLSIAYKSLDELDELCRMLSSTR